MSTVIRVDDTDPGIAYTGQWFLGGQPPQEYNGTTHGAIANGSTVSFSFNGTKITLYGTIAPIQSDTDNRTTTTEYVLDDASAVTVTAPQSLTTQYGFAYYVSPNLADKQHTLTVTATDVVPDNTFWVDYLEYTPSNASSGSSSPVPLPGSRTASSGVLASPSTSSSFDSSGGDHHHHSGGGHSTTVAVAVLVPIIIVLLLTLAGLYLWWRRRFARASYIQSTYGKEAILDEPAPNGAVTPYMSPVEPEPVSAAPTRSKRVAQPLQVFTNFPVIPRMSESVHLDGGTAGQSSADQVSEPVQEPPPAYAKVSLVTRPSLTRLGNPPDSIS